LGPHCKETSFDESTHIQLYTEFFRKIKNLPKAFPDHFFIVLISKLKAPKRMWL
jgi:hypothetical protein